MQNKKPFILQIAAGTTHSGGSRIPVNLYEELQKLDFNSQLATGGEIPTGKKYLFIPKKTFDHAKNPWEKFFFSCAKKTSKFTGKIKGAGRLANILYNIGKPSCLLKNLRGVENFENFPGTRHFFENLKPFPNIIHAHNLHGKYFDLHTLSWLSHKVPVVLTLHDEWLFTGHCACTFDCEKWQTGCGGCPNLGAYQELWRDTTKYNLKQKQKIYEKSKLNLVTPSQWLMDKARKSVLAAGIKSYHVIHNGIDLQIFRPGDKFLARKKLGLPQDAQILLFSAFKAKTNQFKDYKTLEQAVLKVRMKLWDDFLSLNKNNKKIIFLCIGEKSEPIKQENREIRFIKYIQNQEELVSYYQATDLFIHATKSDNFPTTILESFGCGTPVIGTEVGGIPEQINKNVGLLYKKGDYKDLAEKISFLLENDELREEMAKNCVKHAQKNFNQKKQILKHVDLYKKLLEVFVYEHAKNQESFKNN